MHYSLPLHTPDPLASRAAQVFTFATMTLGTVGGVVGGVYLTAALACCWMPFVACEDQGQWVLRALTVVWWGLRLGLTVGIEIDYAWTIIVGWLLFPLRKTMYVRHTSSNMENCIVHDLLLAKPVIVCAVSLGFQSSVLQDKIFDILLLLGDFKILCLVDSALQCPARLVTAARCTTKAFEHLPGSFAHVLPGTFGPKLPSRWHLRMQFLTFALLTSTFKV